MHLVKILYKLECIWVYSIKEMAFWTDVAFCFMQEHSTGMKCQRRWHCNPIKQDTTTKQWIYVTWVYNLVSTISTDHWLLNIMVLAAALNSTAVVMKSIYSSEIYARFTVACCYRLTKSPTTSVVNSTLVATGDSAALFSGRHEAQVHRHHLDGVLEVQRGVGAGIRLQQPHGHRVREQRKNFRLATTQRAILNFTPGPQGWTFSPRGNVHPFVHSPGVNTLYFLEEWGKQRISPPGYNYTPRRQNSPLGDNLVPGVKVCP
jgi:hypothetical protein